MSDKASTNEMLKSLSNESNIQVSNVMKDDFQWEIPVENVPIPSQGKIYPVGNPLHGRSMIGIKAMTAREEDILSSRALMQRGEVLSYLIRSCIVDKSVNPEDLLAGDRNALMVAIRVTGYGPDYNATVDCPDCDYKNSKTFNLGELEIKRLDVDPVSSGENLFGFTLPVSKKAVKFRLLTTRDQDEINKVEERRKKLFPDDVVGSSITARLIQSTVSIDGVTDRNKIQKFIHSMPALDSKRLRKYMDDIEPGISMDTWMKCDGCGEESKVGLPITTEFFWPRE